MADPVAAFPLRLRDPRLRALADEMVVRGWLTSRDLDEAAERLSRLSDEAHTGIVSRSLDAFAEGEGARDPLATRFVPPARAEPRSDAPAEGGTPARDGLGVLAAFRAARR